MTVVSAESWIALVIGLGFMQASPGPAVLTLVGYSFDFGRVLATSLLTAFVVGQLTALVVGVMGFGLVLSTAPEAINVLRLAGGCLLFYFGLTTLIRKCEPTPQPEPTSRTATKHSIIPIPTVEEETHYVGLAQRSDERAQATMVEWNLRLLDKITRCYLNRGLTQFDLIKEGYFALIFSIEKFDPEGGIPFSIYATSSIRRALESALMIQTRTDSQLATDRLTSFDVVPNIDPPSLDTLNRNGRNLNPCSKLQDDSSQFQINNWLMNFDPTHRDSIVSYFGLNGYEHTALENVGHASTGTTRSCRSAVANTWFIAASSPIAIVFYTVVLPDYVNVNRLDLRSFVFIGSIVLSISISTGVFYIMASSYMRNMLASSSISKWISSFANMVLMLAGVWVITSVIG